MDVLEADPQRGHPTHDPAKINDFSIAVATANGTGSQTANLAILRALFKMGIPVNGKNIFPSNIQGLPTWYKIRVNHKGYVAHKELSEILVAFNPQTLADDIAELPPGGVCIYNADWKGIPERDDIIYYGLPVKQFVEEAGVKGKIKTYIANMVFVGGLAQLLGISQESLEEAFSFHFGGRQKLVDANMKVVRSAYEWATENLNKTDPYHVEALNKTDGLIMMTGNEAAALGAIFGGVSVASWYPITPSTSMIDALKAYLPQFRQDAETGKATYAVVQAEDELAAIGMVLGAGWSGARALTATSGPGISLMAEFAGLGYFAEIPAVIWDIQRVGPSTGLPTRTGQCDIDFIYTLGHGDTKHVLLFPATIAECFAFGVSAHDLADTLQTPVFVLSDLDLGMNNWMSEPFHYPEQALQQGKVLSAEEVAEQGFGRYRDLDGDGITYRTLPGTAHPQAAYFTRGTGHNEDAVYSERSDDWLANMDRLNRKFETARRLVPQPVIDWVDTADVAIIAVGTTVFAIEEARDRMADERPSFMRLRALPIDSSVRDFVAKHKRTYVVELNRDGQLHGILRNEMPEFASRLISVAHMDGMPLSPQWLLETLQTKEQFESEVA